VLSAAPVGALEPGFGVGEMLGGDITGLVSGVGVGLDDGFGLSV
jgi:hypothetical protein